MHELIPFATLAEAHSAGRTGRYTPSTTLGWTGSARNMPQQLWYQVAKLAIYF
jgi:hypothetical protein